MAILNIMLVLFFHDFIQQTLTENLNTVMSTIPIAVDIVVTIRDKTCAPMEVTF